MKALTNTSYKTFAVVHERKTSPSSSTFISSRCEICPSGSSNRRTLGHLKASSPHCKAFCFLLGSNSEFGRQTEAAETNIHQTLDGSKVVHVRLELKEECQYGDHFLIVGDDPVLGSWDPLKAVPLSWSDGHIWTVDLDLPVEKTIQYKFICKLSTSDIVWQPGQNRSIQVKESQNVLVVTEEWENAETQSIRLEERVIRRDEPIVDTPKAETSKSSAGSSYLDKKLNVGAKNSFGAHQSAGDASKTNQNRDLSVKDPGCLRKTGRSTMQFIKMETPVRRSNHIVDRNKMSLVDQEDERESIVICNEGCVLVPGLTVPATATELVTKELNRPVLASSCDEVNQKIDKSKAEDEGKGLVAYDKGHDLLPGLTAQMSTEEAPTKYLKKSNLANSLNGADESVNNSKSDLPPR